MKPPGVGGACVHRNSSDRVATLRDTELGMQALHLELSSQLLLKAPLPPCLILAVARCTLGAWLGKHAQNYTPDAAQVLPKPENADDLLQLIVNWVRAR